MGTQLRSLLLQFDVEDEVAQKHLMALSNLTQLHVLHLLAENIVGDSNMLNIGFLASMRSLCDLSLLFAEPLPVPTLLGRKSVACRQLRRLNVWGIHPLEQAVDASVQLPIFSLHEELALGGLDLLKLQYQRQALRYLSPWPGCS